MDSYYGGEEVLRVGADSFDTSCSLTVKIEREDSVASSRARH